MFLFLNAAVRPLGIAGGCGPRGRWNGPVVWTDSVTLTGGHLLPSTPGYVCSRNFSVSKCTGGSCFHS